MHIETKRSHRRLFSWRLDNTLPDCLAFDACAAQTRSGSISTRYETVGVTLWALHAHYMRCSLVGARVGLRGRGPRAQAQRSMGLVVVIGRAIPFRPTQKQSFHQICAKDVNGLPPNPPTHTSHTRPARHASSVAISAPTRAIRQAITNRRTT